MFCFVFFDNRTLTIAPTTEVVSKKWWGPVIFYELFNLFCFIKNNFLSWKLAVFILFIQYKICFLKTFITGYLRYKFNNRIKNLKYFLTELNVEFICTNNGQVVVVVVGYNRHSIWNSVCISLHVDRRTAAWRVSLTAREHDLADVTARIYTWARSLPPTSSLSQTHTHVDSCLPRAQ